MNFSWITQTGDTCHLTCGKNIVEEPPLTGSIDTLILQGETVTINEETYNEAGVYTQLLTNFAGCDSLLTIKVKVINSVVHYDLNACEAFMSNNTHMDYSEFVPAYPQPLSCADITGGTLHRTPPRSLQTFMYTRRTWFCCDVR